MPGASDPFISLEVHPHYGAGSAVVRWVVTPSYVNGSFYVYRSYTGAQQGGWELINPREDGQAAPIHGDQFVDERVVEHRIGGRRHKVWYRVLLEWDGKEYDSPIVAAFEDLTPHEFGLVRRILEQEHARMATRRNGIPVKMAFPAVHTGPCTNCRDADTGQHLRTHTCARCYGSGFQGGYYRPVDSYMELYGASPHRHEVSSTNLDDSAKRAARFLAWPRPWPDATLIIRPRTDERYLVGAVNHLKFKGVIPIAVTAELELLDPKHVAYTFPIKEAGV